MGGGRGNGQTARVGHARGALERRWGRKLPIALLVLSLGVAAIGALEAFLAQRSHGGTATDLLQDYGEFAAWSYERSSWELLSGAISGHLNIAHTNRSFARGEATEACLRQIVDTGGECPRCPPRLSGTYSFFTRVGEPPARSEWAGRSPPEELRAAVVDAAESHSRSGYEDDWPFAVLHLGAAGQQGPIIAYTRIVAPATIADELTVHRDTVLYGFEIDPDRLAHVYEQVLRNDVLLPPTLTRDRPNSEVIRVKVYGPDEALLFASGPEAGMAFAAPVDRHELFGGGQIVASVLPDVAGELIIGGLPKDRTGTLVLIFSLAGALAVLAIVQLRREDQLSLLRHDFVASVSHELRTPLAQVRLFTETLRLGRTRNEGERQWALENIDRETLRLSNLVENILHFSRAERGLQSRERETRDLSEAVVQMVDSFRPLVSTRTARIEVDVARGLYCDVHLDGIRQVVLNLLDNAVRYGPAGQTIRVEVRAARDQVRVSVEDEGPGVPVPERERVFEPFQRGAGSLGSVVVGSGIGLAVAREILSAHGGVIEVREGQGGGALFLFDLPRVRTARPDQLTREGDHGAGRPTSGVA